MRSLAVWLLEERVGCLSESPATPQAGCSKKTAARENGLQR